MLNMRWFLLVTFILASAGCRVKVRVPSPPGLKIAVKSKVRATAKVQVSATPAATAQPAQPPQPPPPPPPPPAPVPIQGSAVVEFFGVPLEGVQDVVFVLDRSGSMDETARGRIAEVASMPAEGTDPAEPVVPAEGTDPVEPTDAAEPTDPAEPLSPAQPVIPAQRIRKIDVAHMELIDALSRLPAGTRLNVVFFNDDLRAFSAGMFSIDDSSRGGLIEFVRQTYPSGSTALAPAMRVAFLMNARRVVLLSDGLGNVGGDARVVLRDALEAVRGGVRIDTIGLGGHQDTYLLQSLAQESGGLYQSL
jgi:Mg-chelatase subunit ChlD